MIVIIAGCGSNLASVQFALERLGVSACLATDPEQIRLADKVILPGVGTAKHAMQQLHELKLVEVIRNLTQPVLGICLGMQLLYEFSAEGNVPCLGMVPNKVIALPVAPGLTIPHMGWNQMQFQQPNHELCAGINESDDVYFVHSYAAPVDKYTIAATEYGMNFTAMVQKDNFFGAQFHPERSGKVGQKILRNFLQMK
ncbi:MAG: imidazole glycerol phosphate synthase subunit HisH [Gammaproteobacteria bacterium]